MIVGRDGEPPDLAEYADLIPGHPDYQPPAPLPDPYRCWDPWTCGHLPMPHLHGTKPDGTRV